MELKEKVVLITGGASWIGLATTRMFLKNGIKGILIADINLKAGIEVEKKLKQEFGENRVAFSKVDIRNSDEFEDAFKKCQEVFGRLDIVINNAGVANEKDYKAIIDVNMHGTMNGIHLGFKYLSKEVNGRGGTIVNVSSATVFQLIELFPVYAGTKSAILTSTRIFGKRFDKTGVKVVTICPSRTTAEDHSNTNILKEFGDELKKFVEMYPNQTPEAVGNAIIYMVQNADSASVWYCEAAKLYELEIPDWKDVSKFVTDVDEK